MIRRPTLRGISLIATSSLVALMLLVPTTSAATPALIQTQAPAPATISDGGQGAVIFSIYNNDTSTVSQLYLVSVTVTGGTFVKAYPSQGTCGTTLQPDPLCTLGQLKPRKTATVIIVFNATPGVGTVTVAGTFNTTGLGTSSGGDNSHGDAWPVSQAVGTSPDAQDFSGRFIDAGGNTIVLDNQSVGSGNLQATKIIAPKTLIGVSAEDGPSAQPVTCPSTLTCFGETSAIEVAGGASFPGGFQVVITIDGSAIPSGINAKNVQIYHTWDSPAPGGSEIISARCTFTNGLPKSMPCLNAVKVNGQDLQITIWTTHNGFMKPA